jgi:hypothetical protein
VRVLGGDGSGVGVLAGVRFCPAGLLRRALSHDKRVVLLTSINVPEVL